MAAVSTGFPAGLSPLAERVGEIRRSLAAGAHEIDVVITRAHVFAQKWQALYDEIATFKEACGPAHMKVILGTGDLTTLRNVARSSLVAMMAGADFIKTSTGKEAVNATLPVGLAMVRAIREAAKAHSAVFNRLLKEVASHPVPASAAAQPAAPPASTSRERDAEAPAATPA